MNCSVVTEDKVFVGCRDRRVYIYNKFNLELVKQIEVPESVHCMCLLNENTQVALGMTDGHVMILGTDPDIDDQTNVAVINAAHFRDVGGIWSICGVNNDTEIALGSISGLHIAAIGVRTLTRSNEVYLEDRNVWNVFEYDDNKIACTRWNRSSVYLIDRSLPNASALEIKDAD